jgi:hypothetical protein
MLTAITLAAAFAFITTAASAAAPDTRPVPAGPVLSSLPPLVVSVYAAPAIPPALVDRTLAEADVIWRAAGVTIDWQVREHEPLPDRARGMRDLYVPAALRVIIDDAPGARQQDAGMPIGWIVFAGGEPEPELHVSHRNAVALLEAARQVSVSRNEMPPLEVEVLLGRAMGRALAHELGHYLFASKSHTGHGLMQAVRSATELFSPYPARYGITRDERRAAAGRIWEQRRIALR